MLSEGVWHRSVPTERNENLAYRLWIMRQAHDDSLRKGILAMCRQDIVFWINSFVYQYNPFKPGCEYGPFVTWDFQDEALQELLWCMRHNQSAVIEKSREMGGTYLCVLVIVWACLFHPWKKFLVISRDADSVDRPGDPDCVFWKIDQILEYLPDWMKGRVTRRRMFFGFPSGSKITGQASTAKAGVGGRATAIFLDEFSQVKEDREVRQRTASTTNCRIFNGTHLGPATEFFKLCQQPEIKKIRMHWTQHPDKRRGLYRSVAKGGQGFEVIDKDYLFPPDYEFVKDGSPKGGHFPSLRSPWYDQKAKDIGDRLGVAMDLDIDPKGSVSQIFDPMLIRELTGTYCRPPRWEGELDYSRETAEPHRLVQKQGGLIKLWIVPNAEGRLPPMPAAFAADVSTGQGVTNSCLSGGHTERGEKFLELATPRMDEGEFAALAVALCRLFVGHEGEGALLGWERQGPGETFGKRVVELGYRNVHRNRKDYRLGGAVSETPGWFPNIKSKRLLINDYSTALAARQFINPSEIALEECLDWKYNSQGEVVHGGQIACRDPSGAAANHGDRSVADAILWMLIKPSYVRVKKRESNEVRADTLAWRQQMRQDSLQREEQWS